MNKGARLKKRLVALLIVFALSIESFGAVVSDNDGSAFITKAEFDSLKNDFQSQIDQYNTSIDSKIDGAIAQYLAGIQIAKQSMEPLSTAGDWEMLDNANLPRYKYGAPVFDGAVYYVAAGSYSSVGTFAQYYVVRYDRKVPDNTNKQNKLLISNITDDENNATAAWEGIGYGAIDYIQFLTESIVKDGFSGITQSSYWPTICRNTNGAIGDWDNFFHWEDTELVGKSAMSIMLCAYAPYNDDAPTTSMHLNINKIDHDYGTIKRKNMIIFNNASQETFSNKDKDRNWLYNGSDPWDGNEIKNEPIARAGISLNSYINSFGTCRVIAASRANSTNYNYAYADKTWSANQLGYTLNASNGGYGRNIKVGDMVYKPCIGFEKKYIKNWNQLYNADLDVIAKEYIQNDYPGSDLLLRDKNGVQKIGLKNGLPLILLKEEETLTVPLNFSDVSYDDSGNETLTSHSDIYVWFKQAPFGTDDPNSEECMQFDNIPDGCERGNGVFSKALKIPSGINNVSVDLTATKKGYVWMKWSYENKQGGGMIHLPALLKRVSAS